MTNLIIDASAACHMPDVIEMPYMPPLYGGTAVDNEESINKADEKEKTAVSEKGYTYRLGGPTCLSGDVIGSYTFKNPINVGDKLIFGDMAIYTTCKNNTFNGMPLPSIYSLKNDGTLQEIVTFGYEDFKGRLGK